jgi:hypothetical protein
MTERKALIPGYVLPLDPDCPEVERFMDSLETDPMTVASGVGDELSDTWNKLHRNSCQRCREYGVANIEVA